LADLGKNEAIVYAKLLKKAGEHCLDTFYSKVGPKDNSFWNDVLISVYDFKPELAELALLNKDSMITTALYDYNR
jgi:hypothetical protein